MSIKNWSKSIGTIVAIMVPIMVCAQGHWSLSTWQVASYQYRRMMLADQNQVGLLGAGAMLVEPVYRDNRLVYVKMAAGTRIGFSQVGQSVAFGVLGSLKSRNLPEAMTVELAIERCRDFLTDIGIDNVDQTPLAPRANGNELEIAFRRRLHGFPTEYSYKVTCNTLTGDVSAFAMLPRFVPEAAQFSVVSSATARTNVLQFAQQLWGQGLEVFGEEEAQWRQLKHIRIDLNVIVAGESATQANTLIRDKVARGEATLVYRFSLRKIANAGTTVYLGFVSCISGEVIYISRSQRSSAPILRTGRL
jgi:hypothetical protein